MVTSFRPSRWPQSIVELQVLVKPSHQPPYSSLSLGMFLSSPLSNKALVSRLDVSGYSILVHRALELGLIDTKGIVTVLEHLPETHLCPQADRCIMVGLLCHRENARRIRIAPEQPANHNRVQGGWIRV